MDKELVLEKVRDYVRLTLKEAESGRDWWHIQRVVSNALLISESEEVDVFIVELGALLHDIADAKFNGGDDIVGSQKAHDFLLSLSLPGDVVEHVTSIVRHVSFKGGSEVCDFSSPEFHVVQDADRLDALGAIGIARTFIYTGHVGREIYNPDNPPRLEMSKEEYYSNEKGTAINHFYEKLLLLKDRMHTQTGKSLAEKRHVFMEHYLKQFYGEWNGEL